MEPQGPGSHSEGPTLAAAAAIRDRYKKGQDEGRKSLEKKIPRPPSVPKTGQRGGRTMSASAAGTPPRSRSSPPNDSSAFTSKKDTAVVLQKLSLDDSMCFRATLHLQGEDYSIDLPIAPTDVRNMLRAWIPPSTKAAKPRNSVDEGQKDAQEQEQELPAYGSEKISTNPIARLSPAVNKASELAMVVGSGKPVDPGMHEVREAQTSAMIDPKLCVSQNVAMEVQYERGEPIADAVLYEKASVQARIRNTLQVGGERPTDVHLFLDKLETPTVRILEAPRREGTVGGRPGENVSDLTPLCLKQAVADAQRCPASSATEPKFDVYVEGALLDTATQKTGKDMGRIIRSDVAATAGIFLSLLRECCKILWSDELPRLVYMSTICADMSVSMKDQHGHIVVNALVFEQSGSLDSESAAPGWEAQGEDGVWQALLDVQSSQLEDCLSRGKTTCKLQSNGKSYTIDFARGTQQNDKSGKERRIRRQADKPKRIHPQQYRRQLQYWTQRIAMAKGASGPTGLYDPAIWRRFKEATARAQKDGRAAP